jgi:hypothetical protein
MQTAELHDDEKQEDNAGQVVLQQVLPVLPQAYGAQGNQVTSFFKTFF